MDGLDLLGCFNTLLITSFINADPRDWTSQDVCQWLGWAEAKFNLGIQLASFLDHNGFVYDGRALCRLTKRNLCFNTSIAIGEILWQSLQRICTGELQINLYRLSVS